MKYLRKHRESSWIQQGETVIALNTGIGIKYLKTVQVEVPVLEPGERMTRVTFPFK
ncbi:hypothetical protein [Paenibacillus pectinilyticus]|uniref:hypothetical protein n=1 Tax=Paenibacillus pectinilyticus TaxID=512399 RepID=UPI001428A0CB|nr:hypothetical protein [Paenibacillus pectinilyticus]